MSKTSISDFLISKGWNLSEDEFIKIIERESNSIAIINGQQLHQPPIKYDVKITYEGEGAIDDTPIYEYSITINYTKGDTVCVQDLDEFINEIYNMIE